MKLVKYDHYGNYSPDNQKQQNTKVPHRLTKQDAQVFAYNRSIA